MMLVLKARHILPRPLQAADGSPNASGAMSAADCSHLRRLLSRTRVGEQEDCSGRRMQYMYTVELQGGELRRCDERGLSRLSLKAAS